MRTGRAGSISSKTPISAASPGWTKCSTNILCGDRTESAFELREAEAESAFALLDPSLNISELVRTKELYDGERGKASSESRPVIVCNGELERTRSNYYPPFWNAGGARATRDGRARVPGVYWISNFKGSNPAVLFRAYPGRGRC